MKRQLKIELERSVEEKYSPYPNIKIDVVIATSALLVIPKSWATWVAAGAIIDDDTGLMNVKDDTTIVAAHFWRYGQLARSFTSWTRKESCTTYFFGFIGSPGPSQSTHNTLASDVSSLMFSVLVCGVFSVAWLASSDKRWSDVDDSWVIGGRFVVDPALDIGMVVL